MEENNSAGKIIDFLFSIKKSTFYLILIFLLGFALRFIAAINLGVTADDMHHVTFAINFLKADRLITYEQSAGLWHAFTSVMYEIFGATQFASRIAPLIFGSFSIFLIYLLSREFFDDNVSLIAAFLLAIAPFHIKNTVAEMDVTAMFFVLFSMLFFVKGVKTGKLFNYSISGIFLGLAIYTKVYPLLFLPSFLLYFIHFKRNQKKQIFNKKLLVRLFLCLIFAAVFAIPALTHNYLLYKDKGFLDFHFTRTFGFGKNNSAEYYSWDPMFDRKSSWAGLFLGDTRHIVSGTPLLLGAMNFIRVADPMNFYFGLIGIILLLFYQKDKREYLIFFLLMTLFIFPFLAANILLAKHFLFLEVMLVPLAALPIYGIGKKLNNKNAKFLFIALLVISLFLLGLPKTGITHFYGKSHIAQLIDFKEKETTESSLIVADSRIYRGRINWIFYGRKFLEGSKFISLINSQEKLSGEIIPVETYFFECTQDDCGWGSVKDQPELNASMENLLLFFKQNGILVQRIEEPDGQKSYYPFIVGEKKEVVAIYRAILPIKESVLAIASQPKNWWIYTVGYEPKEAQFDYYETHSFLDKLLNNLAHLVVWLALILAFLSPIYSFYLIFKESKNETINNNPSV